MDKLLAFVIPFLLVLGAVPLLRRLAPRIRLVDMPDARKVHVGSVPLVGGVAMFGATLAAGAVLGSFGAIHPGFWVGAASMTLIGLVDDIYELAAKLKFVLQAATVSVVFAWGGVELKDLGMLLGPFSLSLGVMALPFTIFGVLGVINAVNLSDGADGLAGGISIVALFWFLLAASVAQPGSGGASNVLVLLSLTGSVAAFLVFNLRTPLRKRAVIFMGDSGSLLLGFVLSWFAITSVTDQGSFSFHPVTVLWILAVPLFDTVSCIIRRVAKGLSPMQPDREHIHHLLPAYGFSMSQTVAQLHFISFVCGFVGVSGAWLNVADYWMFVAFLVTFGTYTLVVHRAWERLYRLRDRALAHTTSRAGAGPVTFTRNVGHSLTPSTTSEPQHSVR